MFSNYSLYLYSPWTRFGNAVNSDGELEEKEKDAKLKEAKKEGEESKVLSSSHSFFLLFILHSFIYSVMYFIPMDRSFSV